MHSQDCGKEKPDAQVFYNQAVRMVSGKVLFGRVMYDHETDTYQIKQSDGAVQTVLRRDVLVVESRSRTFLSPYYNETTWVYPCDCRQRHCDDFFVELRGIGLYSGTDDSKSEIGMPEMAFGGAAAAGLRFGRFGVGLGGDYLKANDITRIPAYLHLRYALSETCIAPFLYAQLGTVFDDQSGEYISSNKITHPGPKIAGFGIGYDFAICDFLPWWGLPCDFSVDLGYRYMQLPTKVDCDCSDTPEVLTTIYHNESHSVMLRAGVTF